MSHKIIFLGSGGFAVPSLRALVASGRDTAADKGRQDHGADFEIQLVVTQPDQPAGRGQKMQVSAVKAAALELGLKVAQPGKNLSLDLHVALSKYRPEALVVVSYGKILTQDILDWPTKGCLNVHPSLLPQYRGSAPIQTAILDGLEASGVTIMLLDAKMDHGPILAQKRAILGSLETAGELAGRLADLGAELLVETLNGWLEGQIEPREQNHGQATYTAKITKEMGQIDWTKSAAEIERRIRAFQPWPGAFTFWEGKMVKVARAEVGGLKTESVSQGAEVGQGAEAGTVFSQTGRDLRVICGAGVLNILELQLEGRKVLAARDFLGGNKGIIGARLG